MLRGWRGWWGGCVCVCVCDGGGGTVLQPPKSTRTERALINSLFHDFLRARKFDRESTSLWLTFPSIGIFLKVNEQNPPPWGLDFKAVQNPDFSVFRLKISNPAWWVPLVDIQQNLDVGAKKNCSHKEVLSSTRRTFACSNFRKSWPTFYSAWDLAALHEIADRGCASSRGMLIRLPSKSASSFHLQQFHNVMTSSLLLEFFNLL
jgi:hypothetical protein